MVGALITEYRWFTKKRDYVLKRYQEIPQTILERRNGENKMDGQIVLREYQTSDRPALIGIIRETWQYDKFASPKTAQKLLGHAKLSTTMDIYTHVYGDAIAAAAEKMKKSF